MKHVVQLGAEGNGAATAYTMLKNGVGHLTIIDIDAKRSAGLSARFGLTFGKSRVAISGDLADSLASADGLIYAMPTGMRSQPGIAVPVHRIKGSLGGVDVVYFPLHTELLRAAITAGCRTLDGSGMAVHQATEVFRLFSRLNADPERMHHHFLSQVSP
ncbi:MAG: hypothetical protein AB1898_30185 [Acidobacteriota bacterium]